MGPHSRDEHLRRCLGRSEHSTDERRHGPCGLGDEAVRPLSAAPPATSACRRWDRDVDHRVTTFSTSLSNALASEGLNSKQSAAIAARIRAGVSSEHVAANYWVPLRRVQQIADVQRGAMDDGLRAHGRGGAGFTVLCLVIFVWSRRRQEKTPDAARAPR